MENPYLIQVYYILSSQLWNRCCNCYACKEILIVLEWWFKKCDITSANCLWQSDVSVVCIL